MIVVGYAYGLHPLAQSSEIALDTQGSHVAQVMESEGPGKPLYGTFVPAYGAGRAVADAAAEEKCIQSSLEALWG